MTIHELSKKTKEVFSNLASILGIITAMSMFILYVGSMQHRITNVEKDQEDCVTKKEFVLVVDAINKQTETLSTNQHSINSEQNNINNKLLIAIEKNSIELEGLKETNNKFYDYFKGYTQQYFKMKKHE